jgi:hypothetical protein
MSQVTLTEHDTSTGPAAAPDPRPPLVRQPGFSVPPGQPIATPAPPAERARRFGLTELVNERIPIPPNATKSQRERQEDRRRVAIADHVDRVAGLIAEMVKEDATVKDRRSLSAGLFPRKPSSKQYQYAKHKLTPVQREVVLAVLEDIATGVDRKLELTREDALKLWTSLTCTQLRTHPDHERRMYHWHQARVLQIFCPATLAAFAFGGLPAALPLSMMVYVLRNAHRDYYRSDARAEYAMAFNGIMEMLRSPVLGVEQKHRLADSLMYQYIDKENLILVKDRNELLKQFEPDGPQVPKRDHTTLKVPPRGTAEEQEQRLNRVIEFAQTYKTKNVYHDPELEPAMGQDPLEPTDDQAQREINASPRLSVNIKVIFDIANNAQQSACDQENADRGRRHLPALQQVQALNPPQENYDDEPNADAFSAVLQRLTNPPNDLMLRGEALEQLTPEVRAALAFAAVKIVRAIEKNPEVRKQIFDDAVGGPRSCNQRTLEVFNRLGKLAEVALLLENIKSGIEPAEAAKLGLRLWRQQLLELYLQGEFVDTPRGRDAWDRGLAPEAMLLTKLKTKKVLDLSDAITEVRVASAWTPTMRDLRAAISYVQTIESASAADIGSPQSALNQDPQWCKIIIALAEKHNPVDAMLLRAFTNTGEFAEPLPGATALIRVDTGARVPNSQGAVTAFLAQSELAEVSIPGEDDEQNKDLREDLAALHNELAACTTRVKERFAAHYTPFLLTPNSTETRRSTDQTWTFNKLTFRPGFTENPPGALPVDGKFEPRFELPRDWPARVARMKAFACAAEIEDIEKKIAPLRNSVTAGEGAANSLRGQIANDFPCVSADDIAHAMYLGLRRRFPDEQHPLIPEPEGHRARLAELAAQEDNFYTAIVRLCDICRNVSIGKQALILQEKELRRLETATEAAAREVLSHTAVILRA